MITADVLLILIFAVSILLSIFAGLLIIGNYRAEVTIVRAGIFGITGYFMAYIVISAFFFMFDFFSIFKCSVTTLAAVLIVLAVAGIMTKFKSLKKIKFDKKEFIFFALIIICVLALSGKKFGYYGMGQDQGVYQTKAIELIYGNNANVLNFDYALKALENPNDYTYFRDRVKELQGYYLVGQTEPFHADDTMGGETGLEGLYHGLPTWPAVLALFGKMFGIGHMMDCQTVFFICFLMLAFYTLENFKIKVLGETTALAILGSTSLMVWISKSALTEMFLAVIMAFFVYMICNENRDAGFYMWIPVTVFSVFHVSAYTIMPLFVLCAWINILSDKRKRSVVSALLMLAGYLFGFVFSIKVATLYASHNYFRPLSKVLGYAGISLSNEQQFILVVAIVLLCGVITLILPLLLKSASIKKLIEKLSGNKGIIIKTVSLIVMAFVIVAYARTNKGSFLNPNMNFVAMSFASGIISIPLIIAGLIFIRKEKLTDAPAGFICLIFLYVMIWAVLFRPNVSYYYYYGRYDVPYLMILTVFLFVVYRNFEKTEWIPVLCLSSVFVYLNYDIVMNNTPDDTKVEWDVIETELEMSRLPNSAVIMEEERETLIEWMLILKASGEDVYPYNGNLDLQTDSLLKYYDNIYFLYEDDGEFDISKITSKDYKSLYTYTFNHSEDMVNGTESWIGYPDKFFNEDNHTYLYLYSESE